MDFNKIEIRFNTLIKYILAFLMMAITVFTFYQVVMRYVFSNAPYWSEELVRFLFVWVSFIGAAIGIKEGIHIGVDVLVNLLPETARNATKIITNSIIIVFSFILIKYGLAMLPITSKQPSPALGIPMNYIYLALPVGGVLMIYYTVSEIIKTVKEIRKKKII